MRPLIWNCHVEPTKHAVGIFAPRIRHRRGGNGVFEDQIPSDYPSDELAHRRVRVGVGTACDGNHRGEFRVTKPGKGAADPSDNEREHDRWTRAISNRRSGAYEK